MAREHASAAHRDGSPYLLRIRQMPRVKRVGRTVSVSRRGNQHFFVLFVCFADKTVEAIGKPSARGCYKLCRELCRNQLAPRCPTTLTPGINGRVTFCKWLVVSLGV